MRLSHDPADIAKRYALVNLGDLFYFQGVVTGHGDNLAQSTTTYKIYFTIDFEDKCQSSEIVVEREIIFPSPEWLKDKSYSLSVAPFRDTVDGLYTDSGICGEKLVLMSQEFAFLTL